MDLIGIGYIGIQATDIEAWRTYATQVLGMGISDHPDNDPDSLYLRMDDRRYRIALHPGKIDKVVYIGWEAKGRIAYLDGIKKLKAAGIEVTEGDATARGVREVVRFKDPTGYQHELFYGQKWSPGSFVPGRIHTGFKTEGRGFGHVVLMTPDFSPELEHFLLEVMGMHWYGWGAGKGKTGFFRCKLNDLTSHDIGYGHAPGRMGIQHIGIFVNSIRDVGETYDLVKKHEMPMMMTLGQHTQDPHMSFYHFGPSGFAFETIAEYEPWPGDPYELNPEKLSVWGHELVGPIIGPSVKTPEELLADD